MTRAELEEILRSAWDSDDLLLFTPCILDFIDWICQEVRDQAIVTLRDILVRV